MSQDEVCLRCRPQIPARTLNLDPKTHRQLLFDVECGAFCLKVGDKRVGGADGLQKRPELDSPHCSTSTNISQFKKLCVV